MIQTQSMTMFADWTCATCGRNIAANVPHSINECANPYPRIPEPTEASARAQCPTPDELRVIANRCAVDGYDLDAKKLRSVADWIASQPHGAPHE